eukprot:scaffold2353_cov93-Skeletonema_dohrnii-CCMP3373.AAC.1
MPSKKKKKSSKARKGDNRKKKEEEQQQQQQGPLELDTQMERLKIVEDSEAEASFLDEAIKLAAAEKEALKASIAEEDNSCAMKCYHGYVPGEDHFIIDDFGKIFLSGLISLGGDVDLGECLIAASRATAEKYPEAWEDPSTLKQAVSLFASNGTQHLLEEDDIRRARFCASSAFFLQARSAYIVSSSDDGTLPVGMVTKMVELTEADLHTLVKYLKKNIPCNCLDKKYKEVKSITKMGKSYSNAGKCIVRIPDFDFDSSSSSSQTSLFKINLAEGGGVEGNGDERNTKAKLIYNTRK